MYSIPFTDEFYDFKRELNLKSQSLQTALSMVHPEWQPSIAQALMAMDQDYLQSLAESDQWLPGWSHVFAAFSQPLNTVRYVLLGESPYPRRQSANGYAFWDAAVGDLWSESGLSKTVNRATSLRNLLKMLMYARNDLQDDFSQTAIAELDKTSYVRTLAELFQALLGHGFLLLNASLVYEPKRVVYHAKHWRPFMASIFQHLHQTDPHINLILLGNIAQKIAPTDLFPCFLAEHPYVISFIRNPDVVSFFQPFNLLAKHK